MSQFEKGFTAKEVLMTISALTIVAVVSFVFLNWMSGSIDAAKETKYVRYVGQMKKAVEGANTLSAFRGIVTSDWVCLGVYSATAEDYCWGKENSSVINNSKVDKALTATSTIPKGQLSPYDTLYNRGTAMMVNSDSVEIKVFVGDSARVENFCRQVNMINDPEDPLSCILAVPLKKN